MIDTIAEEQLCERAVALGRQLSEHLTALRATCPALAEVRGLGSMIAAEFRDPSTGAPSAEHALRVQRRALDAGLLLLTCGTYGNVIRFLYPLTIPQAQFDAALGVLAQAMVE